MSNVRSLGWFAAWWIEHYLVHGPGDVQDQRIELDEEFLRFIVDAYRVTEKGQRVYEEALLSRPKGRAKSELAGMIVCFEFLGPCRYDHFAKKNETYQCSCGARYTYMTGEPVGRPVVYPFIRCLATEEGQSGNTYDNVSHMLDYVRRTHGEQFPVIDLGNNAQTSTRIFRADGGEIRPSTSASASKDGGKETFSVFDETHLYNTRELRRMYEVVRRNTFKRAIAQPWVLQTSTMYAVGEDSIAERTMRAKNRRLLIDHKEAPANYQPDNKEHRVRGLREVYGPAAKWVNIDSIADFYDDPRCDPNDWVRHFFNRPVAGSADLLNGAEWDARGETENPLQPGEPITLGFDGSQGDDATALVACRVSDGKLFTIGVWENPGDPRWRVPREEVDRTVTAVFNAYNVQVMFADPNRWENYIDTWSNRWPKRVAEEWPGRVANDKSVRAFLTAFRDGMKHDGNPILARHVKNAVLVHGQAKRVTTDTEDPQATHYLQVRKRNDRAKIDACIAAMLAVKARGWVLRNNPQNTGRTNIVFPSDLVTQPVSIPVLAGVRIIGPDEQTTRRV